MLLKTIILPDFLSSAGVSVHVSRKKKKILLIITRVIINTVIMRRRYVAYIPIESKKHVKYCGVQCYKYYYYGRGIPYNIHERCADDPWTHGTVEETEKIRAR